MIRIHLLASNVIIGVILVAGLNSCTDSEQQAQIDRQKRIEAQEAQAVATPESTTPEEPEAPAEPEKVDNYTFTNTVCQCHEKTECGMTFWNCVNGKVYGCMHDAIYAIVSVNKTDDDDGNCSQ